MFEAKPLVLKEFVLIRTGAVIVLSPVASDLLEAELAATDAPLSPTPTLLVDGQPLQQLAAADAAATALQLVGGSVWFDEERFTLIGRSPRGWQVLDPAEGLDQAELVTRIPHPTGWLEMLVVPIAGFWLVLLADPAGDQELVLIDEGQGHLFGQAGAAWQCALRAVSSGRAVPGFATHA